MIEFKDIYWLKQILLMKKLCQVQFEWRQEIAPVQHAEDRQSPQDEEMLWNRCFVIRVQKSETKSPRW